MEYLEKSEEITGYRVRIMQRKAFKVAGYTIIVPPRSDEMVSQFWYDVAADGRLELLKNASSVPPWILGLGSWDPECERHGQRYTICIEETEHTDFTQVAQAYHLFTKEIGASDWMCFEMTQRILDERFWKDNPYKMMKKLGYRFHTGDYSVGLHFDAYPPDYDPKRNPVMEFWITVKIGLWTNHATVSNLI
jgi:predicted transcriptional regulator YdeE